MQEPGTPTVEQKPIQKGKLTTLSTRTYIIGGIVVAILVAIAALFLVRVDGYRLIDRIVAQYELSGIFVVERTVSDIQPNSFGFFGLTTKTIKGVSGTLDDYASGAGVQAAIVTSKDSGFQEVWVVGKNPRMLAAGPAAKASLAISSDGTFVAYASRTDESQMFAGRISSWAVHVIDLESGRDVELGVGFDPEFFVREGAPYLLYTSADGVVVNSLAQRDAYNGFITPIPVFDAVDHTAKVSSDGMYVAMKDSVTHAFSIYSVYRVTADQPLGMEPLMTPVNPYTDIIFADNAAYGIDNSTEGTGIVWKIHLDGSATETNTYTFPTTYANRFIR
ncbi:hypothetical protein KKD81_00450 [Patescibacteria group bacterium]|nr:hypothetical protein [Patescibacteria group bacterium]MBU2158866.1 hypothetical protein [Patescibacteria group bacterium]MBU2220390.1 hypothetical protein [Patescibacteria group bacterium]